MAHNAYTPTSHGDQTVTWTPEPCDCAASDDHDYGQEQDHGPDVFESDRPDLDFWDYEPSPYSGDYSEM